MPKTVALGEPTVGDAELEAVSRVFASGWLSGAGPTCREFEEQFAAVAGTQHALATSNCGSALHLGLDVLGAGAGDEVIVGDYTFPATGHSVVWTGAKPVFADVRPDIWTSTRRRSRPRSRRAPSASSPSTSSASRRTTTSSRAIADQHGLWLMEDAACSAGATYKGRPAGSPGRRRDVQLPRPQGHHRG